MDSKPRAVRIVSYNVRYFGHALRGLASTLGPKRRIAAGLAALSPLPDLVCLQEVETISLRSRLAFQKQARSARETQLEAFMARMEEMFARRNLPQPFEAFYFRAHTYRVRAQPLYTTGLAVLINRETLQVDQHNAAHPQNITHHHVVRYRDRKQTRICAHMKLRDRGGRPFHVFNTHFSLPTPFAAEFWKQKLKMGFGQNQVQEARTLGAFIRRTAGSEPFIVCGDLNSAPDSPVYECLRREEGLEGAQERLGQLDPSDPKAFPTAGFMRLRMHLDHLFCGQGVRWLDLDGTRRFGDAKSPFHGCSDHVPLIARFVLGPAQEPKGAAGAGAV